VPVFGGSLRVTAQRAQDNPTVDDSVDQLLDAERAAGLDQVDALMALGDRGRKVATALHGHLTEAAEHGRTVAAYGAPSKATVLLSLAGVNSALLPYTVDLSPNKHGCRIPGTGVPVRSVEELIAQRPDEIVVLTWDIAPEIVTQIGAAADTDWDPDIFVPLPDPGYLAGPRARS
jgi:hypothetical protein